MKTTITLLLAIVLAASAKAQPKIGDQVSEVALADVNGKIIKLSDLKGKWVLIDFWASWCSPCRRSNKELVSLYAKYRSKGFEIYAISIDEDKSDWKKAIRADRMTWIQVIETGGWDGGVASKWMIEAIPASFLLDRTGKIVAVNPGKKKIAHLINQSPQHEATK